MSDDLSKTQLPHHEFFDINVVDDKKDAEQFFQQRETWCQTARKFPLASNHVLLACERWQHLDVPYVTEHHSAPLRRPVPALALQDAFTTASETQYTFTLETQLQGGENQHAQIWTALMQNSETLGVDPARVVLKIFQESFSALQRYSWRPRKWPFSSRKARTEAWAYFKLQKMQGCEIPWSFGFFKFRLHSGEYVIAHAMEHIDGVLTSDPLPPLSQRTASDVLDSMAHTFYNMHTKWNVSHGDLGDVSNRLICHQSVVDLVNGVIQGQRSGPPTVFIGFSSAEQSTSLFSWKRELLHAISALETQDKPGTGIEISMLNQWREDSIAQEQVWSSVLNDTPESIIPNFWGRLAMKIAEIQLERSR